MATILGNQEYCSKLAKYLADYLNQSYANEVTKNTELPSGIIVRSTRNWDDPSVPLSQFPLLKVYRNSDTFDRGGLSRDTTATITYSVSYPNLETLPDLLYWASYVINKGLIRYQYTNKSLIDFPSEQSNQAQYLLTVSESSNAVYPFLRFQIRFLDDCLNFGNH
jgi:hypothetical protein